ncbi:YcxB family protein [Puniceicoccaceae bacterium K14]|nr:YcxB family protein [Puniceicoccaceae bacterium K14]
MFRRNLRTSPAINKEVEWRMSMDGFSQISELGKTELTWESVYQSYSTKNGYLIYPQKNMYYWVPRSGFASDRDFDEVNRILKEKTENKIVT